MQIDVEGESIFTRETNHPGGCPRRDGRVLGPTQYSYEPRAGSVNLIKKPSSSSRMMFSSCDRFRSLREKAGLSPLTRAWRNRSITADSANAIGRALHHAAWPHTTWRTIGAGRAIAARAVIGQAPATRSPMHSRPAALGDEGDCGACARIGGHGHGLRAARKRRQPEGHGEAQSYQASLHASSSCAQSRRNGLAGAGFPERRGRQARWFS